MSKISHLSHGAGNPRAKPVHVHDGMTDRQTSAMHVGGMGHPVESGAQPGNILDKPAQPKRTSAPVAHSSMRHRSSDAMASIKPGLDHAQSSRTLDTALGQKILAQANHIGGAHVIDDDPNGAC